MGATKNSDARRKFKVAVFGKRQCAHCCFCRSTLSFTQATLEHITPLSLDGKWELSNLTLSCRHCNTERGNADFNQFRDWKRGIAKERPKENTPRKVSLRTTLDKLTQELRTNRV